MFHLPYGAVTTADSFEEYPPASSFHGELTKELAGSGTAVIRVSPDKLFAPVLATLAVTALIILNMIFIALPFDPAHVVRTTVFTALSSLLLYQALAKMALPELRQFLLDLAELGFTAPVLKFGPDGLQYKGQWQVGWGAIQSVHSVVTVARDCNSFQCYLLMEVLDSVFAQALCAGRGCRQCRLSFSAGVGGRFKSVKLPFSGCYLVARVDSLQYGQEEIEACVLDRWKESKEVRQ